MGIALPRCPAAESGATPCRHPATSFITDIKTDNDIPRAQAAAQDTYRMAATEGYLKMASLAGTAILGASMNWLLGGGRARMVD
ncbi:MAG: hypothetical protein R2932_44420 [Caldilineaceae bacterium]